MGELINPVGKCSRLCGNSGLGGEETELLVLASLPSSFSQCSISCLGLGSSFITVKMEGWEIRALTTNVAVSDSKPF